MKIQKNMVNSPRSDLEKGHTPLLHQISPKLVKNEPIGEMM